MGRLDGKVAVITGGASGIGAATTELFIAEGAKVLVADMQAEVGEKFTSGLGDAADFRHVNVTNENDIEAMIGQAIDRFGRLDCVYNNAGFGGALGPIAGISAEDYDLTMDVLVKGVFFGMKHAAPIMTEQGSGSIISTASVAGLRTGFGLHLYSVAKAAVIHLTKSVANELADHNVRVNCIAPGVIPTPLSSGKSIGDVGEEVAGERVAKMAERSGDLQPLPRAGQPLDIAKAALFLASDDSEWVTGTVIPVDGGWLTGRPWRKQPGAYTQNRPIKLYNPESTT